MRPSPRRALLAATTVVLVALPLLATAPPAGASPKVRVAPNAAPIGSYVTVYGQGFPARIDVQAVICGNGALDGSSDCDLSASQEVATTPQGTFQVTLGVTAPPTPCPCAVMVNSSSILSTPTVAFSVIGAPVTALRQHQANNLQVRSVSLEGSGPWYSWFGGEPQRTMVLTVENPDSAPFVSPPLVIRVGSPGHFSTVEATQPLGNIGPYQARTYRVPVTFSAFSIGDNEVQGTLGGPGQATVFAIHTFLAPWGLFVLAFLLLQALLIWALTRRRRRQGLAERETAPPGGGGEDGTGERAAEEPTGEAPAVGVVGGVRDTWGGAPE